MLQSTDFSFCAGWMTHCLVSGMFCTCVIVWRSWWMEDKPAVQGRLLFQMFHVHKLIALPHCNCSMHAVQRLIFTALRLWSTFSKLSMTASKSCEGFFGLQTLLHIYRLQQLHNRSLYKWLQVSALTTPAYETISAGSQRRKKGTHQCLNPQLRITLISISLPRPNRKLLHVVMEFGCA